MSTDYVDAIGQRFAELAQQQGQPAAAAQLQAGLQAGVGLGPEGAAQVLAPPARRAVSPRILPITATAQISAAGLAIVNLGTPNDGYFWAVQLVLCSDAGAWSNSMGAALGQVAIGQQATDPTRQLPPHYVRWPFGTMPNGASFSRQGLYVSGNDQLFFQITGGTANQVVQATAVVEVWGEATAATEGYWT